MLLKKISSFQLDVGISFALSMLGSVLNYVLQIVMGNMLTIEEFGIYNAINSLVANTVIIYTPLSIMLCQFIAGNVNTKKQNTGIYKQAFMISMALLVALCVIGIFVYPGLNGKFGADNLFIWELILFTIGIVGIYNVLCGVLQGLSKFAAYGFVGALLFLIRLILSMFYIKINMGMLGIILAMLLSYVIMFGGVFWLVRKYIAFDRVSKPEYVGKKELFELYGVTFIAQIILSFYINGGELLLMNFLFDDTQVGLYSSAVTLGKVSMYIVSIISVVLLPTVASRNKQGINTKKMFYQTVAVSLLLSIVYSIFLLTVGKYLILLFFGNAYRRALEYIPSIIAFIIPLNALTIIQNYFIGIGKVKEYTLVAGIVTMIAIAVIWLMIKNMSGVAIVLGVALSVILVFSLLYVNKVETEMKRE